MDIALGSALDVLSLDVGPPERTQFVQVVLLFLDDGNQDGVETRRRNCP